MCCSREVSAAQETGHDGLWSNYRLLRTREQVAKYTIYNFLKAPVTYIGNLKFEDIYTAQVKPTTVAMAMMINAILNFTMTCADCGNREANRQCQRRPELNRTVMWLSSVLTDFVVSIACWRDTTLCNSVVASRRGLLIVLQSDSHNMLSQRLSL